MIGTVVKLDAIEQVIVQALAKKRYSNNRSAGVRNSKIGNQSNEFTDLEGMAGEFAFCKLFNIYPDFSISTRSSSQGEDRGDTKVNGEKVDVKTTKYATGKLLAVTWKKTDVDLFALMTGVFPKYVFRGFMKSEELIKETRLGDLGYGKTYIAKQSELKDLVNL